MCVIKTIRVNKNVTTFTGYKYVLKINNKFYSPATGVEYKIGKVQKLHKGLPTIINKWNDIDTYLFSPLNSPNYNGFTSVFKSLKECIKESKFKYVIVKMTLSDTLYHGYHSLLTSLNKRYKLDKNSAINLETTYPIICGKEIVQIEEVSMTEI